MEKDELEAVFRELDLRQHIRGIDDHFGFVTRPEQTDLYKVFSVMGRAYEDLAYGIHENVQVWSVGDTPLLRKVITPTVYMNGRVAATKTEFLLCEHNFSRGQEQPGYIEQYTKARGTVYEELFQYALQTSDLGPLLSVITTYQESDLASRLMRELYARKERYPDMIAGDAESVLRRIDRRNNRIEGIRRCAGQYALAAARREFFDHTRLELNDDETGIFKAVMLGAKIKYGGPRRKSKWTRLLVEDCLREIMKLPSVPEQLIKKEMHGIPITEDREPQEISQAMNY